jgi:hypothetical protein
MALRVEVDILIRAIDGTPLAHVTQVDLTFNADPERFEDEVPLAVASIREQLDVAVPRVERKLEDWARVLTAHHDEVKRVTEAAQRAAQREAEGEGDEPD